MKRSFGKLLSASVTALVLASFAMAPCVDAAAARGGGGGGRAAGAGGGGGGRAAGGGGGRQGAQVNNSKADTRTNNVRSSSTNDVDRGWDRDYHPGAAAAVVGTAAVVGAAAASSNCTTVYSGGVAVQQCQ
jgi:hypothetical protein